MASVRALHVVCLFIFLLSAWRIDCQTTCSEHLGARKLSNIQTPVQGKEPQVCVSNMTCCTDQTEDTLRVKAVKKMKTLIDTKYMAAKSSLLSLLDELKAYFQRVVREAHRQSAIFLLNTQKNLTTAEVTVISTFFKDLENYVVDDKMELQDIVNTFFRDSFPLVLDYVNPPGKTVADTYRQCLKTNMETIQPFGKRPAHLVGIYEQIFQPVRELLSSLKFAIELMNKAQQFNFTSGCKKTLLQMEFCSLCQGFDKVMPCYSYCKEALRRCMSSEILLQTKWGKFIENVYLLSESIAKSSLENLSNAIYKDLWNAAMYVLIQKQSVMKQVLDNCGTPQYINAPYSKTSLYTKSVAPAPHVKVRLFSKMESAKLKVLAHKSFYEGLPEELCVVEELSARQEDSEDCWNGKSIGRYTGLESSDVEMSAQEGNHLKLLMDKLHEKNRKIRKLITDNEVNEVYESGSSSGSGGQENGSADCVEDDEDCGSGGGWSGSKKNEISEEDPTKDPDIYMVNGNKEPSNEIDDEQGGGASNASQSGNVLAHGNVSSQLASCLFNILALLLFSSLIRNWQS